VAEFALKIVEALESASLWAIDDLFIKLSLGTIYFIRDFKIASKYDLRHETRKFNGLVVQVFSPLVEVAESLDADVGVEIGKLIKLKLSGDNEDVFGLMMKINFCVKSSNLRMNLVHYHPCIPHIFMYMLLLDLRSLA
jgi:hypothetical protein